jgi:hypothetical protein
MKTMIICTQYYISFHIEFMEFTRRKPFTKNNNKKIHV